MPVYWQKQVTYVAIVFNTTKNLGDDTSDNKSINYIYTYSTGKTEICIVVILLITFLPHNFVHFSLNCTCFACIALAFSW